MFENPGTSTRRRSQEFNIPLNSLTRIPYKVLSMATNKIQLIQKLKSGGHQMRFRSAEWTNARLQEDPRILLNKSYFPLVSYVKKTVLYGTQKIYKLS